MKNAQLINIEEIDALTRNMARQNPAWADCSLDVNRVNRSVLQKCLNEPLTRSRSEALYASLEQQAAALLYMLLKHRPFEKHNNRIAFVILAFVMERSKQGLKGGEEKLLKYLRWMLVAPEETKEDVINAFAKVLE